MACVEYPLCDLGYYANNPIPTIFCSSDGNVCVFQRFCENLKRNIHSSAYVNCREAKKIKECVNQNQKLEIESHKTKQSKAIKICNVKYYDNDMYIDFEGYGIFVKNPTGINTKKVSVEYVGIIGTPEFSFTILENK